MVRPLDNQENMRVNEYAGRIRQPSASDKGSSRDFSFEFSEAVHEVHDERKHEHEMGEDTYEASDEQQKHKEESSKSDHPVEARSQFNHNESTDSPLDIVV